MPARRFSVVLLGASVALGACNLVTGADEYVIAESEEANGGTGGSAQSSGANVGVGASGSQSNGAGASGSTSTSGAGPSTNATSAVTSAASTGATASSATSVTSSTSNVSSSSGGEMCGGAGPATTPLDGEEQAFMVLINNYRAQNGLGALADCVSLNRTAQGHSEDMRDNNYFSHTGLNNSTPWARACDACFDQGCGPSTAMAENIAAGNSGAQATFDQWKNSPGHNANMLDGSFTMIGVGRATGGGQYGVYWTNVFAGDAEPSCY